MPAVDPTPTFRTVTSTGDPGMTFHIYAFGVDLRGVDLRDPAEQERPALPGGASSTSSPRGVSPGGDASRRAPPAAAASGGTPSSTEPARMGQEPVNGYAGLAGYHGREEPQLLQVARACRYAARRDLECCIVDLEVVTYRDAQQEARGEAGVPIPLLQRRREAVYLATVAFAAAVRAVAHQEAGESTRPARQGEDHA